MFLFEIGWTTILRTISQILTAGVAITAFALFLYAMAFNLQDRVAQSFALILSCVVIIYTSEAIGNVSVEAPVIEFWLRLKWLGIIFLPATYLHFSDALLTLTGRPSRGRRQLVTVLVYLFSFLLLATIPTNILVGRLSEIRHPAPYLERTFFTNLFSVYYAGTMIVAGINIARAVRRSVTKTSRRRLIYLFTGATAPAIAAFPFMLHGTKIFSTYPALFWSLEIIGAMVIGTFLVLMAYSVAFFGVTWTDRVVKTRLFKWLMRGPFTASVVLGLTTIIRRIGEYFGDAYSAFVPISMVGTILLLEYLITLLAPFWEKWLFYGTDRDDLSLIRSLEDHLLTRKDLNQFLEIIVASICDRMQATGAFIAVFNGEAIDFVVKAGEEKAFSDISWTDELYHVAPKNQEELESSFFQWGEFMIMPLTIESEKNGDILLGICGFSWQESRQMDGDTAPPSFGGDAALAVTMMGERAALALKDRRLQQQVLDSLVELQPEVNYIQKLRAKSRYDQTGILSDDNDMPIEDFTSWVKDALAHFWGGPKLTDSPLLSLKIVQEALAQHKGNYANALRSILKNAIEHIRPEGDRRFTGEWILYNILELKFIEGKKVREIASRLAMSEADLYRKQRIAIEAVAKAILEMENNVHENSDSE